MIISKFIKSVFVFFVISFAYGQDSLISQGSVWSYYDLGVCPGDGWQEVDYDDNLWKQGAAQFGYGDGDEFTVLNYGTDNYNKIPTSYFRKKITIKTPEKYKRLALSFLCDDGIVVYINAKEVLRYNMPYSTIEFDTYAKETVRFRNNFKQYFINTESLLKKENVIAVEIHQEDPASLTAGFDLQLESLEPFIYERNIRKAPYLTYNGDNKQMQLNWQLNEKYNCEVHWGNDPNSTLEQKITREYTVDHLHKFLFKNLKTQTKYYYKVIVKSDTIAGSFVTAPEDDTEKIKFFVYGDTRSFPENHDRIAKQIISTYSKDRDFQTILISVGDIVCEGDMETSWDRELFDPQYFNLKNMFANIAYQAVIGNHERTGQLYKKYFPYPFISLKNHYWSFDYGPIHIVMIDQYTNYDTDSPQLKWLEKDLENSIKKWKFLVYHEPGWTAGEYHGNNLKTQQYILPLCQKYGVQIVFAGHQHYYSRSVVDGIQHVTTGGGGALVGKPNLNAPFVVSGAQEYHFCKIEIDGEKLNCTVITDKGETIDNFQLNCEVD